MSSTYASSQFPSTRHRHLPRFLRWTGLAVFCMVLGAGLGVYGFGPRMVGGSLSEARFHTLNNRIRGVLLHAGCDLHWTKEGRVTGLRLADREGKDLLRGDIHVPAITSSDWEDGVLPKHARLELDEVVLHIDERGDCSLLEQLRPRTEGGVPSPFFDKEIWSREGDYRGHIASIWIQDERAKTEPVQLSEVDFVLEWGPERDGRLVLDWEMEGGGSLEANLTWRGSGPRFALETLEGVVSLQVRTEVLGNLLGVPDGLVWLFGQNVDAKLVLGGASALPSDIPFSLECNGKGSHYSLLLGRFDGQHWSLVSGDGVGETEEVTQASGQSLVGSFKRMGSHDVVRHWLASLSAALPQSARPIGIYTEANEQSNWDLHFREFRSGVGPRRADMPLLEGWLAAAQFSIQVVSMAQVSLQSADAKGQATQEGESLNLDQATLEWSYAPQSGEGNGTLNTAASAKRLNELNAVLSSLSFQANQGAAALVPTLDLRWRGSSPFPSEGPKVDSVVLANTLTSYFQGLLPAWGASLPNLLGKACTVTLVANSYPDPTGVKVPCWMLKLQGLRAVDIPLPQLYFDGNRLWTEPRIAANIELDPVTPQGIYARFVGRYLPWLAEVRLPNGSRDGWLVELQDLVVEPKGSEWTITKGSFDFRELPDDVYSLAQGWRDAWGAGPQTVDGISIRIDQGRVHYEELEFPVGMLSGSIDLDAGEVRLKLEEVNPLLKSLPSFLGSDAVSMEPGNMLQGSIAHPTWLKPMSAGGASGNE